MKPEQRLLLALTLTLGILIVWSAVMPPPKPSENMPQQIVQQGVVEKMVAPSEPSREISLPPYELAVGNTSGGIKDLRIGEDLLMQAAQPGLFQVELLEPAGPELKFSTEQSEEAKLLTSKAQAASGLEITRVLSLNPSRGQYLIDGRLILANRSDKPIPYRLRMAVYKGIFSASPRDNQYKYGMAQIGPKTVKLHLGAGQAKSYEGSPAWVTSQGRTEIVIYKPEKAEGTFHVEHPVQGAETGWLEFPAGQLLPGEERPLHFTVYAGPIDLPLIRAAGLEDSISFGLFSGIAKMLLDLLRWTQARVHSIGLSILLISFGIWVIFFPVTWSSVRMMKNMAKIQPQVEKIRKEHGNDPQRMNKEMLELYRKYRVNPLSGCLPLLLQMPIFISLFQALNRYPALKGSSFLWMKDLSKPDALFHFGIKLPFVGESFNLLPVLMMAGMFVQQKMSPQNSQKAATPEAEMQQKMFKFFPLLFGFLFYSLPAGLMLYWVTNTSLTLTQYWLYARLDRNS